MSKKIEWYYFRNGWTSCKRASKFLEARNIEISEKIPASRKLQAIDAKKLIDTAKILVVAKGKKVTEFNLTDRDSEETVSAMLGPTGNLRAPTAVYGNTVMVGFNESAYSNLFD